MKFESPWFFLLLPVIIFLVIYQRRIVREGTLRFLTTRNIAKIPTSFRQKLIILLPVSRTLAMAALVLAIARPQKGMEKIMEVNRGTAIMIIIDRSGSMNAEIEYAGEKMTRLEAAKRAFSEFVLGGRDLKGRPHDLVGVITFARYPNTVCPLTLAHDVLPQFLKTIQPPVREYEDGTAIGDAIALGVTRLKIAEETLKKQSVRLSTDYEIKSKVIILLTDGQNNCGKRTPRESAELASKYGIKIYTIGVGGGQAFITYRTPMGVYRIPISEDIDEKTLKQIASITGGIYRRAQTGWDLQEICKELDQLEKSELISARYVDYTERFQWFAVPAFILLVLEVLLRTTVFSKLP
jgi:Ca-activated chloride channel family protein